jgi:geranylgeranyl diphosphate synthase type II
MFKENPEEVLNKAIVVEAFHNFTLMHDDIMDAAPLRRGKTTVHHKWDTPTAILSGDAMLVHCYQMLGQESNKVINDFSKTAMAVCQGQMMDMDFETREDVTVEEYLEMIRLKTAVLIGYSMELGALLAGANEEQVKICYDCGVNMGLSFQIMDDLLDAFGEQALVGKQIGGDILADKKTYLSLLAIEKSGKEYFETCTISNEQKKVSAMLSLYDETGVKKETEELMESYYDDAIKGLKDLNVPEENKESLINLFEFLFNRTF